MAQTNAIRLYDLGFGRWLDRFASRNFRKLTGHFTEFLECSPSKDETSSAWQIGETDLLRAEIHPKEIIRLRKGRRAA